MYGSQRELSAAVDPQDLCNFKYIHDQWPSVALKQSINTWILKLDPTLTTEIDVSS